MAVAFVDIAVIKEAIAEVRNDQLPTNWVLLSYTGENTNDVALVGKGDGGAAELINNLQDNAVGYGLVRLVEKFDNSDTVKFVFIRWIGEQIHRMLRARLGTHSGAIKELLSPYHVSVEATTKDEVTEDIIIATVRKAAGTAVHVLDRVHGGGAAVSSSSSSSSSSPHTPSRSSASAASAGSSHIAVPKQSANVSFPNEQELKLAILDVRNDGTDTNWVLASYDGPNSNNIVLLGTGNGGSEELISNLKDDIVAYGLVRQTERFDDSQRTMFAHIVWTGANIHRMLRARLGTHSGAIKEIFSPYHVSINAENDSEISAEIITTTIRETMGTASKVRN